MKSKRFKTKHKFFAIILAFCFIIPTLLTGCSFGGNPDNGDNPPEQSTPTLTIGTDSQLVYSEANSRYEISLYAGATYTLDVNLGDYTGDEYSIVYSWNSSGNNYASIENKVISIKSNAPTYVNPQLTIKLQKNGSTSAIDTKKIYITIYELTAELTSFEETLSVEYVNALNLDFRIKIPMAGKFYKLPSVDITNIIGNYDISYEIDDEDKDKLNLRVTDDANYIMAVADPSIASNSRKLNINVYDTDGTEIKKYSCSVEQTYEDPDIFQVYYGNNKEQIKNNETLYIEKTELETPIVLHYNGNKLSPLNGGITITSNNENVVTIDSGTTIYGDYEKKLEVVDEGSTTVKFKYDGKEITINVVVYNGKELEGLSVPMGADAFKIVDNNVYVNGKIYALFSVGKPEAINGNDDLSISIQDTANANIKRVAISYEYKGRTKTLDFDVEVEKSGLEKTELTQNYRKYWNNNGYITTPYEGEARVLAIPVWFTDSNNFINASITDSKGKTQKEQIIEDLTTALFGSNDELAWRSLRTYYLEESFGKLNISGKVSDWYEVNKKSTDYGDKDDAITTLTESAINWYFNETGEERSDYDANNDGKIDHIIIFYGSNYHCSRNGNSVDSAWCRRIKNSSESYLSNFSWISALKIYGLSGLSANTYNQLEKNDLSTIHGLDARTIIHEFAHAIGIEDVYDTSMKNEPSGAFTMESGDFGGHDPYNMMAMGWATPYVFDSSDNTLSNEITITINDFQSSGDIILLTPQWNSTNQIFDEYILLELYTPTGLNSYEAKEYGANCAGIRVWHINANIDSSTNNHFNTNNSNDGNYDLVHFIRNDEDIEYKSLSSLKDEHLFVKGDTFDMETFKSQFYNADGKLDNGTSLGWSFEITNITTDASGNATATIKLVKTA